MFNNRRAALSLLELVLVLAILVALGGMAIRLSGNNVTAAQAQATDSSLVTVRDAIAQYWSDTKLVPYAGAPDTVATEAERFHLLWLFRNPVDGTSSATANYKTHHIGWNGPYLLQSTGDYLVDPTRGFTTDYGSASSATILDAHPITLAGVRYAGSPLVVQDVNPSLSPREIRIVSAGPNGIIDTPANTTTDSLTALDIVDDEFVTLQLR